MPNFSGKWSQNQILYNDLGFYKVPGAPTSVSATTADAQSVVSFTAPTYAGLPATITGYKVTASTGGSIVATATGSASPITVTGLTNDTTYDISVQAQNAAGYGDAGTTTASPVAPSQIEYTTAGSYTWVAPSGLNPATVSIVCVGGGGSYGSYQNGGCGGGGGGLAYRNNYAVTAGNSYTVNVGARATTEPGQGGNSYFLNTATIYGGGGHSGSMTGANGTGGAGGVHNQSGGNGGAGGPGSSGGSLGARAYGSGGGAGGYSGNGGTGNYYGNASGSYQNVGGTSGAGGAGAGGYGGSAGGGVGLLGEGSSGTIGSNSTSGGSGGNNNNDGVGNNFGKVGGGRGSNSAGGWSSGGVRIIYSFNGTNRTFPNTNTGDL